MKSPLKKSIGEVVTDYGARVMKVFKKGLLQRSLFDFYGDVKADKLRVKESASVPATPIDGDGGVMYTKSSDGKLYYKSNEVAEVELSAADTVLTSEQVQDIVGAMVDGGTETNITVTYDDTGGKLNFVSTDTNTTYSEATSSAEGLMSTAHHDKLDGIEAGATADQTQADINALNITAASCTGNAATADALTSGNKTITGNLTVTTEFSSPRRKFVRTDSSNHFEVEGDVLYFGSGSTTQGDLCYLKEDGSWGQAHASGAATGDDADRDAMGMLAIALGTDPDINGMLIRGIITMDYDLGDVGNPVYVKTTTGGMTHVAPSGSGDFVRVVGYCLDDDHGIIYFNPDSTWVEIA
jgi:hypothetical protein